MRTMLVNNRQTRFQGCHDISPFILIARIAYLRKQFFRIRSLGRQFLDRGILESLGLPLDSHSVVLKPLI